MSVLSGTAHPNVKATAPARTGRRRHSAEQSASGFAFDVAIIGLGYVGLPTALAFHNGGARVLALDISCERISAIQASAVDLLDSDLARLASALEDERFTLSTDTRQLSSAAAVIVCVPTPVDEHLTPDLGPLRRASETVVSSAAPGQLVMLTSTTYVGCTEDLVVAPLERRGLVIGRDVFVAFSAERIDPGNDRFPQEQVPRVLGAATEKCEEAAEKLLRRYATVVHRVRSLGAAEMTKLVENTFRAVNIALANEFADICSALDIDIDDVTEAAATKPYGFMAFTPGPGVGGHCIPCDPHYLLWQLRRMRVDAPLISQAMSQIAARPGQVVDRVREVLSDRGRGLAGSRVIVVGVAYKPNVADLRESPAIEIISSLSAGGAEVRFVDGHIPAIGLPDGTVMTALADAAAFAPDIVLIHTRHDRDDLSWIDASSIVLDCTYRATDLPQRILL